MWLVIEGPPVLYEIGGTRGREELPRGAADSLRRASLPPVFRCCQPLDSPAWRRVYVLSVEFG